MLHGNPVSSCYTDATSNSDSQMQIRLKRVEELLEEMMNGLFVRKGVAVHPFKIHTQLLSSTLLIHFWRSRTINPCFDLGYIIHAISAPIFDKNQAQIFEKTAWLKSSIETFWSTLLSKNSNFDPFLSSKFQTFPSMLQRCSTLSVRGLKTKQRVENG